MPGPNLKNLNSIAVGFMDVMVDKSSTHIAQTDPQLTHNDHSLGAMANTEIVSEINIHTVMAGSPQIPSEIIATGENLILNGSFMERSLRNLAFARGEDPTNFGGGDDGSGEINLGNISEPANLRVEGKSRFPNGKNLVVIMPRAQVSPSLSLGANADTPAELPITINSLPADDTAPGGVGDAVWNNKPLGALRLKLDT